MFLNEQRETPFDLKFRLFGTHIRVSPWFWLVAVFINFELASIAGIEVLLLFVLCVFVSILLHEFGHIWMGRLFGSQGYIVLQSLFGLAIGAKSNSQPRWQRIAISLAGPGIQIVFAAIVLCGIMAVGRSAPFPASVSNFDMLDRFDLWVHLLVFAQGWNRMASYLALFLLNINLWWAMINLLPIWPLDGGQVSRELFTWADRNNGVRYSLGLSIVTASIIVINSISIVLHGPQIPLLPTGGKFFIVFFALFIFMSFVEMQAELARSRGGWRDPDDSDRLPWESDPDDWKRGR